MSALSALQSAGLDHIRSIKFNVCERQPATFRSVPLLRYVVLQYSKMSLQSLLVHRQLQARHSSPVFVQPTTLREPTKNQEPGQAKPTSQRLYNGLRPIASKSTHRPVPIWRQIADHTGKTAMPIRRQTGDSATKFTAMPIRRPDDSTTKAAATRIRQHEASTNKAALTTNRNQILKREAPIKPFKKNQITKHRREESLTYRASTKQGSKSVNTQKLVKRGCKNADAQNVTKMDNQKQTSTENEERKPRPTAVSLRQPQIPDLVVESLKPDSAIRPATMLMADSPIVQRSRDSEKTWDGLRQTDLRLTASTLQPELPGANAEHRLPEEDILAAEDSQPVATIEPGTLKTVPLTNRQNESRLSELASAGFQNESELSETEKDTQRSIHETPFRDPEVTPRSGKCRCDSVADGERSHRAVLPAPQTEIASVSPECHLSPASSISHASEICLPQTAGLESQRSRGAASSSSPHTATSLEVFLDHRDTDTHSGATVKRVEHQPLTLVDGSEAAKPSMESKVGTLEGHRSRHTRKIGSNEVPIASRRCPVHPLVAENQIFSSRRSTKKARLPRGSKHRHPRFPYLKRIKRLPPAISYPQYLRGELLVKFRQTFTSFVRRDCNLRKLETVQLIQRLGCAPPSARISVHPHQRAHDYRQNRASMLRVKFMMKGSVTPSFVIDHLRKFRRPPFRTYVHLNDRLIK